MNDLIKLGLLKRRSQQNDQKHIRQGVNNIDNTHDDQVDLSTAVAGDGSDGHTDDQNDDAGEEADGKRDAGTVNDADEIVTALRVGTENVGEDFLARFHPCQLRLTVCKGSEIVVGGIDGTT